MGYKLPLTNLQNVAAGNVATLKVPVGANAPTYDQIKLELSGGMTVANIEWVHGKINGRIFLDEGSGTVINDREDYRGIFTDTATVVLDFSEPRARNGAVEQLLASIPGHLCQDLTFEIKIASGATGTIKAYANYRPPTSNPYVRKLLNTSQSFGAAGTEAAPQIMYLPVGGAGGKVKRVWIHEGTPAGITGVALRIGNNAVHEVTRTRLEHDQKRMLLVPQAGIVVLDFVEDGNLAGMLDTEKAPLAELRIIGSANTYTVYTEMIDPIGRL